MNTKIFIGKSICRAVCTVVVTAVLFSAFLSSLAGYKASASSLINLSLTANKQVASSGDEIVVSVVADNFPNIVSFGGIDFHFDTEAVMFEAAEVAGLPENFNLTYDDNEVEDGLVVLFGRDEIAINQLAEQAAMIEDGSIDDSETLIDPSFSSTSSVALMNLRFRVIDNAPDSTRFYLTNAKDFKESSGEFSIINLEDGITVTLSSGVSNDASITDLKLNGYDLVPAFNEDDMIYQAQISKDVTDVVVTAVTSNSKASIRVVGNTDLDYGKNTVTIEITAEDGYTKKVYYIIVLRPENLIPVGAGLIDTYGKAYNFADFPQSLSIPDGFVQTTRQINGYDVPVFARDDVSSVLVYLQDENGKEDLYFYNINTRSTTRFNAGVIIKTSKILTPAQIPVASLVPSGFSSSNKIVNDVEISGFANDNGDFIAYFKDEDGKTQFYRLDEETMEFIEYQIEEKNYETEYKVLFLVFVLVAAAEGILIILIAATINRISKSKAVPRAKRV
ncbi:MAG: cadherin-like beta sandwich domain-containing protein [Clostridia bacterium]|nr:cadherin-like beta sandwich domain-containing protein [Clostridia bacterium]